MRSAEAGDSRVNSHSGRACGLNFGGVVTGAVAGFLCLGRGGVVLVRFKGSRGVGLLVFGWEAISVALGVYVIYLAGVDTSVWP